jgi:hypothetical protein
MLRILLQPIHPILMVLSMPLLLLMQPSPQASH